MDDGIHGYELWVSNGTTTGTKLIRNINPGDGSANVSGLTRLGSIALFSAYQPGSGNELWRTDGQRVDTFMVKDIN